MRHECTGMIRAREIQTIEGRQAYELYKVWLESQKKKGPSIETFCTSAYYSSFLKFTNWIRDTRVPDPGKYIEVMNEKKISPALWRRSEAYEMYLEFIDKRADPYDQVGVSVETIQALSDAWECKTEEVFSRLTLEELLELIQQRRLSPWLLFCSKSFKIFVSKLHPEDRSLLMTTIGSEYWAMKLERNPEVVVNIRKVVASLGV